MHHRPWSLRRSHRRGRSLPRFGRSRCACLARPYAANPHHFRTSRSCLRVPHLRDVRMPEPDCGTRRDAWLRVDPCARTRARGRRDAGPARRWSAGSAASAQWAGETNHRHGDHASGASWLRCHERATRGRAWPPSHWERRNRRFPEDRHPQLRRLAPPFFYSE